MKVYISADIEGISGVVDILQLTAEGHDYSRARKLMTDEVNAAIRGALSGGASEVVVNDSHGYMTNLLIEELHEEAKLITGKDKRLAMMAGFDSTFNAVVFIGYHGRQNTGSVLGHSYHGRAVSCIRLNGREVGEMEFNSYIAGHFNVPVVLVSGDDILADQVNEFNSDIERVIVKNRVSSYSANCMQPIKVHQLLEKRVKHVLEEKTTVIDSCKLEGPIELEVTFFNDTMADSANLMPGSELVSPTTVKYVAKDIIEAFNAFWVFIMLGNDKF